MTPFRLSWTFSLAKSMDRMPLVSKMTRASTQQLAIAFPGQVYLENIITHGQAHHLTCYRSPKMLIFRILERLLILAYNQHNIVVKNLVQHPDCLTSQFMLCPFLAVQAQVSFLRNLCLSYLPYKVRIVILTIILRSFNSAHEKL